MQGLPEHGDGLGCGERQIGAPVQGAGLAHEGRLSHDRVRLAVPHRPCQVVRGGGGPHHPGPAGSVEEVHDLLDQLGRIEPEHDRRGFLHARLPGETDSDSDNRGREGEEGPTLGRAPARRSAPVGEGHGTPGPCTRTIAESTDFAIASCRCGSGELAVSADGSK